jgi:hypothetical protein
VNLTVPLATWLGLSGEPGHATGAGPLDAADSRGLADALAAHLGTRWCLTFTDARGHPVIHGCARTGPPSGRRRDPPTTGPPSASPAATGPPGVPSPDAGRDVWTFALTWLGGGDCDHAKQTAAYQPTPTLRHLVKTRQPTCTFPGCQRPGSHADLDHTIPYGQGGRTCLCNLGPLCRHHHQVKQARGWTLQQTTPGTMTWTTPAGRHYTVQHHCP